MTYMYSGVEGHATVMEEAEEVIRNWLKDVETAEDTNLESSTDALQNMRPPASSASRSDDFLSSLDWEQGNVADNAKNVVRELLRKDLSSTISSSNHRGTKSAVSHDPRVAMEIRHRQVRERRKLRDQKHKKRTESELLLMQAQQEAKEIIKNEERLARDKASIEEKLLNQQIVLIRHQLREQQGENRKRAMEQSKRIVETEGRDGFETSPVVIQAEEMIKSEKKRQQTRSELFKQLEEAKTRETKEDLRLIHRCFFVWYDVIVRQRAKLNKAVVVREWKLMVKMWGGWKKFVFQRRVRRERDMATREMQRMQRENQVALKHYQRRLLLRGLGAWRLEVRLMKAQRDQLEEQELHRRKMDALLQMAVMKGESQKTVTDSPVHSSTGDKALPQSKHIIGRPKTSQEPAIWRVARQQLNELISDVDAITVGDENISESIAPAPTSAADLETSNSHSYPRLHNQKKKEPRKPKADKPTTKAKSMAGMASRTAAIAERKAARDKRRESLLKEKAEQLAREEEERQRVALEAKEALIQQKREDKRLAKQREAEKLRIQQLQAELNNRASAHYRNTLLKKRGLVPWQRFVEQSRASRDAAELLHTRLLKRTAFRKWLGHLEAVVAEKDKRAREIYNVTVLKRAWRAWIRGVVWGRKLEAIALEARPYLLLRRVFLGWCRVSKEERTEYWEKTARARLFRQRYLQRQVLKMWYGYIPLAKEERAKEGRRAELRRKVCSWLSDFQPNPQPE